MRVGIGYSERNVSARSEADFQDMPEPDWLSLIGFAIADAVSGAAGFGSIQTSAVSEDIAAILKERELKIHYSGMEIINIDCSIVYPAANLPEISDTVRHALLKNLFMNNEQLNIKFTPGLIAGKKADTGKCVCMAVALLDKRSA